MTAASTTMKGDAREAVSFADGGSAAANVGEAPQVGTLLTRDLVQKVKAAFLTGAQKHRLVEEVCRRESLGRNECAWGKDGGIITTEGRCMDKRCGMRGRTHKVPRRRLTPEERWNLYAAANVTHVTFGPPAHGAKKQKQ